MTDAFFTKTSCDRCSGGLQVRTTSWFTEETICMDCSKKEQEIKEAIKARGEDPRAYEGCGKVPELV